MLQGTVPFKAPNMKELHESIKWGEYKFPVEISSEAKDIIKKMLVLNPSERISIPEILAHPWIKEETSDDEDDESDLEWSVTMSWD